jgi:hypothetical protein
VRNNAFPVWEELIEVVVRAPEDQVAVQLLGESLDDDEDDDDNGLGLSPSSPSLSASSSSSASAAVVTGDATRKLSQRLRLPHYDKRFCCDREVNQNNDQGEWHFSFVIIFLLFSSIFYFVLSHTHDSHTLFLFFFLLLSNDHHHRHHAYHAAFLPYGT